MTVFLVLLAVLAVTGAGATLAVVLRDGHGRLPTRPDYDTRRPTLRD